MGILLKARMDSFDSERRMFRRDCGWTMLAGNTSTKDYPKLTKYERHGKIAGGL